MNNITQSIKIIALALVLSVGISYVSAWTAPTAPPSGGNAAKPINVSSTPQVKAGSLGVSGLLHGYGVAIFDGDVGIGTLAPTQKLEVVGTIKGTGFQMSTGAGVGKVLTSDASGNASWQ